VTDHDHPVGLVGTIDDDMSWTPEETMRGRVRAPTVPAMPALTRWRGGAS
jgi:hypothetical protein